MTHLSEHEVIDFLLHELVTDSNICDISSDIEASESSRSGYGERLQSGNSNERAALLWDRRLSSTTRPKLPVLNTCRGSQQFTDEILNSTYEVMSLDFMGLNALEIAAVANAKKFLSQRVVQKIVNDIWAGDIVFWESLSVHTKKRAHVHNKRYGCQSHPTAAPYRLVRSSLIYGSFAGFNVSFVMEMIS